MTKLYLLFLTLALTSAWSQRITDRRTAEIRGGGGDGKCTIEVEVDGVAEVEISGRNATIRTLNGAPATFRRFLSGVNYFSLSATIISPYWRQLLFWESSLSCLNLC